MSEKRTCNIVQDLLPNYIENLTSKETNDFIEEHLNKCEECTNMVTNMKNNLVLSKEKIEKGEVDYMKKFNKEKKKLKIWKKIVITILILFIILILSIIPTLHKMIVISSLAKKHNEHFNSDNWYAKVSSEAIEIEIFCKDGKSKTVYKIMDDKAALKDIETTRLKIKDTEEALANGEMFYSDAVPVQKDIIYSENENKIVGYSRTLYSATEEIPIFEYYKHVGLSLKELFMLATDVDKIENKNIEGKEYYCMTFKNGNESIYFDKETGLEMKKENLRLFVPDDYIYLGNDNIVWFASTHQDELFMGTVDCKYSFGTVKDEDLMRPDPRQYDDFYNSNLKDY